MLVDWLPWNHTFGGNHNFNMVLRHGGTLYIDGGKPVPALLEQTVRNLREVSPTIYFNVPRGLRRAAAAPRDTTRRCASRSSRDLRLLFYAGAALPQDLWDALEALARAHAPARASR